MKLISSGILIAICLTSVVHPKKDGYFNKAVNRELVEEIKQANSTWTPYEPEENHFRNWTDGELK